MENFENLSVKNVKLHDDLSEETPCFTADVYKDGKLFAYAKNNGIGGCSIYYPAKGFSPKDTAYLMGIDPDSYIMELAVEYDFVTKNQRQKLLLKKGDKLFESKLHFTIADVKKKQPKILDGLIEKYQTQGYIILNRNL